MNAVLSLDPVIDLLVESALADHYAGRAVAARSAAGAAADLIKGAGLDHPTVVSFCLRLAVVDFDLALALRDGLFIWEGGQPLWPDPDG